MVGSARRLSPDATRSWQIESTVVEGIDYFLLDADGKIAEVTTWWRTLLAGVQMQGRPASTLGMHPWTLVTTG